MPGVVSANDVWHRGSVVVVDAIREIRPPFSPEAVVDEFTSVLKTYRVNTVTGDRYGGEWPEALFRRSGITYKTTSTTKSNLYLDLLATLNSGKIELLDDPTLLNQLCGLERKTGRGGRESIERAPAARDDLANVVAGVARLCVKQRTRPRIRSSASSEHGRPAGVYGTYYTGGDWEEFIRRG